MLLMLAALTTALSGFVALGLGIAGRSSAGTNVEGQDVGLDAHGHSQGMTDPVGYWHADDIEKSLEALLEAGAKAQQEVRDVGGASRSPP